MTNSNNNSGNNSSPNPNGNVIWWTGVGQPPTNVVPVPGTHQWITVSLPSPPPQLTFTYTPDPDLAVPVEEKKKVSNGCTCVKCLEFYPYASHPEDEKFFCWACRHGY